MDKKNIFILVGLVVVAGLIVVLAMPPKEYEEPNPSNQNEAPSAVPIKEGQVKQVMKTYKGDGISFQYPDNVDLEESKQGDYLLNVKVEKVSSLAGTMGYDKVTAEKNIKLLEGGQYGDNVDWPFEASKKVARIDKVNAQDFVVFSRFEVCSVVFERTAYFFHEGNQFIITLSIPKDLMISRFPQYFKIDKTNCGDEYVWDFDKQEEFYKLARNGELGMASDWLQTFDSIIKTIKFDVVEKKVVDSSLIFGRWQSLDDSNSEIEFNEWKKFDYYQGAKVSEGSFSLDGSKLIVTEDGEKMEYEILEISKSKVVLSYLARGNTLSYKRVE